MAKVGGAREGAGRPAGSLNRRHAEVLAKAAEAGMLPVEFMLNMMRNETLDQKDRAWAAEKAAPYLHPRPSPIDAAVEIELPETKTIEGVEEALETVIRATASGQVTPNQGSSLVGMLEARRKAIETGQVLERLAAIEARLGDEKGSTR